MKYLDGTLCLEYSELVPKIMKEGTYNSNKTRGNIITHGTGGNGRTVYIDYEALPAKYKDKVVEAYGNPYEYVLTQPILDSIKYDQEAFTFYTQYELPNGDRLPASEKDLKGKPQINYVSRYTIAASWLNMVQVLTADKASLKKELNISVMDFWKTVGSLIKTHQVKLPASRKHLIPKLKEYTEKGYVSLIDLHKFGNSHSLKIKGDVAQAYLFKLLSLRNKHDDTIISEEYSRWAIENKLKPITPEAVGYWRRKWHLRLSLERDGMSKTVTKYSKQIQRDRATTPLYFINGDDNVMDVYFRTSKSDWYRPVLYVVIDTYNDYILGYAWGDSVTTELVIEAYRNANRHIKELTGANYTWQQLQTDRWGISNKNTTDLEKFYRSTGVFTAAQLNNSQSKYIERSFGTVWHQTLKRLFPQNYAGHNLTAKERLNPDTLSPKNFPIVSDADSQIHAFIEVMRRTTRKGSDLNRQQEWLQAFGAAKESQKRLLTEEQRLQIFGKRNTVRNTKRLITNKITSKGLEVSLMGSKVVYELSQVQIAKHIGTSVNVIYDEADLSQVLITDGKKLRLMLSKYQNVPAAIADYQEGDRERILRLQEEKKQLAPSLQALLNNRDLILERAQIDAEGRLQAGVLTKEITHKDQQLITAKNNGASVEDLIDEDEEVSIFKQMKQK